MPENRPVNPISISKATDVPSREETAANPTETLKWLSDRLTEIYTVAASPTKKFNRAAYSNVYTAVWNFCHVTNDARTAQNVSVVNAKDLYAIVEKAIQTYCRESLNRVETAGDEDSKILSAYTEQWAAFLQLTSLMTHLLQPLEDRWIRREIAEVKSGETSHIYHVPQLHMMAWKAEILTTSEKLRGAMVSMQQKERESGSESEESKKLFEASISSLSKVGLALSEGSFVAVRK